MALTQFSIPSYNTILQSMLDDYRAITSFYGYNISVDPGSEIYLRYSGIAGQRAVMYNIMNVLVNSKLIDTATGPDLDRVANDFGLQRRGATSSIGFVGLVAGVSQTLTAGNTLTGPNSLQFQVSQSGVYVPGANVPITSVDQGSQTNLPVGSIMTWSSPQANMQSTCLVSVAVTGGADAEDDGTLRNRLYLTLQAPPQAGNSQQLVTIAGSTDGVVQGAFVYGNFNGAGTQLIALTGYQTFSYIGRDIPHLPTDGYVSSYGINQLQPGLLVQTGSIYDSGPYNHWSLGTDNLGGSAGNIGIGNPGQNLSNDTSAIYGQLPAIVANPYATVITTVNNQPSDVAAVLTLPYPVGAAINGYGNGWMDFTPWPVPDGYFLTDGYCKVISVGIGSNNTVLTVAAPSSGSVHASGNGSTVSAQTYNNHVPVPGSTHIQWINRSDFNDTGWQIVTATLLSVTDNGNDTWNITLDTPLSYPPNSYDFYNQIGVNNGQWIFPASVNAQNYLDNMMQQYALLGPGQTTASQGLLTLGASRYPSSNAQFPVSMGAQVERALVSNNNEVYAASINPSNGYNTAFAAPPVNAPPNIWIPRRIGFYPQESYNFGNV